MLEKEKAKSAGKSEGESEGELEVELEAESEVESEVESEGEEWSEEKVEQEKEKLEQKVYHFAFPKMHLPSYILDAIRRMGSPDNFNTDISELLHIENVKNAYRASNQVDFIQQML